MITISCKDYVAQEKEKIKEKARKKYILFDKSKKICRGITHFLRTASTTIFPFVTAYTCVVEASSRIKPAIVQGYNGGNVLFSEKV